MLFPERLPKSYTDAAKKHELKDEISPMIKNGKPSTTEFPTQNGLSTSKSDISDETPPR